MYATLIAAAALWGAATGLLVPRAAYRLSVAPDEPWRDACPAGHPFTGPVRGWLGAPRCTACGVPAVPAGPTRPAATGAEPAPAAPTPTGCTPTATSPTATPHPATPHPATPTPLTAPVVTALVCGALAAATGPRPELVVWLLAAPVAVVLALVDLAVHRLPDRLTLPLAAGTAVLLGGAALLPGNTGAWPSALLGGLALGAGYFVLFLVHPSGMGFGDVKLALALGVALGWYGWGVLFVGAFAGFLLGAVYGFGLVVLRRATRKSVIPFGPFMIGGTLLGLLLGAPAAVPVP
ncbi:prepilin peptidase [Streptomyces lavendofoliae]|uniref:Prepilin peptidase n=1 Tax=Streptomyces lavendofoliae TaxID=67314 RepID=A0A918HWA4_9ACTN|nr:A24 family peptidase [Streptomyces lavendofoliae]GGU36810.1 prepilin peptidase [Streptomyces lavendofoliae]